ncbi:hypothetical protein GCM10023405_14590 [Streptomonospora salina]
MVLTNVLGPALVTQAVLPHLKETRGRLVVVGSVAGVKNTPGNLYSATKWAVHALAENTRLLAAGDGVGVTLVAPGMVDTPFWDNRGGRPDTPYHDRRADRRLHPVRCGAAGRHGHQPPADAPHRTGRLSRPRRTGPRAAARLRRRRAGPLGPPAALRGAAHAAPGLSPAPTRWPSPR